ncbi:hypothetical protein I6U48_00610 [Clostridium sp. PL3]|uniref:Uncharacterized protein n=1 Tax=Clostridium thailandense TaxID=2794346 RepID=A0A949TQL4_9CLOT|nr:hypothetical protein [Clostridium thailandense]MBV7271421.1 hypothetical protein [Clostridium thailandense]
MKRTIIGAAVIAVMVTSITTYAATNFQQGNASNQGTQNLVAAGTKQQVAAKANQEEGSIEYSKMTYSTDNGSSKSITETWLNTKTLDLREDINNFGVAESADKVKKTGDPKKDEKIAAAMKNSPKYTSTYKEDMGKHIVNIIRDDKGNAVNGNEYDVAQENAKSDVQDIQKNRTFAAIKASYADPSVWKDAGTEITSDGKKLKKVQSGDMNGEEMHLLYLNEDGLPVKSEVYVNGKLFGVATTEYKSLQDDGKIFDTSGVKLQKLEIK